MNNDPFFDATITRYQKLLGREPEQHEIQHLMRTKEVLDISDNDALWLIIMVLESYHTRLDNIPRQHEQRLDVFLNDKKNIIEKYLQERTQATISDLTEHVLHLAKQHYPEMIKHAQSASLTIILLTGLCCFLTGIIATYILLS